MVSHEGINGAIGSKVKELEYQNLQLRLHNLRLLEQLEKSKQVLVVEVKQQEPRWG